MFYADQFPPLIVVLARGLGFLNLHDGWGGEFEPNTSVISSNIEVFKGKYVASTSIWFKGKGLQRLCFKVWSMCRKSLSLILPFSKKVGGAFENNLSSGGGNLKKKTIFESSNA